MLRINEIAVDVGASVETIRNEAAKIIGVNYDDFTEFEISRESIDSRKKNNIKIISSMGTGRKLNPLKLTITDIRKTSYDPIAKILRKMIKDEKITKKIPVVTSTEQSIKTNSKTIGSTPFVPGVAGLMMASYVINDMIGEKLC